MEKNRARKYTLASMFIGIVYVAAVLTLYYQGILKLDFGNVKQIGLLMILPSLCLIACFTFLCLGKSDLKSELKKIWTKQLKHILDGQVVNIMFPLYSSLCAMLNSDKKLLDDLIKDCGISELSKLSELLQELSELQEERGVLMKKYYINCVRKFGEREKEYIGKHDCYMLHDATLDDEFKDEDLSKIKYYEKSPDIDNKISKTVSDIKNEMRNLRKQPDKKELVDKLDECIVDSYGLTLVFKEMNGAIKRENARLNVLKKYASQKTMLLEAAEEKWKKLASPTISGSGPEQQQHV
ncbi:hypothetical protein K6025_02665 [Ehrlichia sp. JZT12]